MPAALAEKSSEREVAGDDAVAGHVGGVGVAFQRLADGPGGTAADRLRNRSIGGNLPGRDPAHRVINTLLEGSWLVNFDYAHVRIPVRSNTTIMNADHSPLSSPLARRDALRLATGALLASWIPFSATSAVAADAPALSGPYVLPPLPYAFDALEPYIDAETMQIHHDKHHKAYVDNANKLLADQPELQKLSPEEMIKNLSKAPEAIRTGLRNNAGGHVNHTFFWQELKPGGGGKPTGKIAEAITKKFGSFEEFQKQFNDAATKRFGSGWAWLVLKDGDLVITSTANQDNPMMDGDKPIMGLDVWEHAYYLKYRNKRPDYITAWWNLVNWDFINETYDKARS